MSCGITGEQVSAVEHLLDETRRSRSQGSARLQPEKIERMFDLPADALSCGGQRELVLPKLFGRDGTTIEDRMICTCQNGDRLVPERLAAEAVG